VRRSFPTGSSSYLGVYPAGRRKFRKRAANMVASKRWITWLNTPDPAKGKMGKVMHLWH
jgi:hypothetical protein